MPEMIESDVLIVGGGGAAARAALEAHLQGSKVVMVMKGKFGECGATAYKVAEMAGYNVADGKVDPQDNPREHFKDICRAAAGMCDEGLAKILTEKALLTIPELEGWGVNFEKDGDGYLEVTGCFASRPRMHVIKGHSEPILAALKREIERRNIQILEFIIISDLLIQDGVCLGALGINERREFFVIKAKSTILATGGAGQLFLNNLNPPDITGDGYALGYRAGAEMVNMEFMQAGLGIIYPIRNILNSWVWLLHPRVYNKEGKEFLQPYL
jgi:fumarate reductase (CoM/CoB) subunit A